MGSLATARETVDRSLRGFRHQIPRQVLEELAQEALLRTLDARGVNDAHAFARRAGRHLAIDWLRRRREVHAAEHFEAADRGFGDRLDARLDAERVWRVLRAAPASYRTTLERLYRGGEEVEDLARAEPGAESGPEGWARARDVVYKRRSRALGWARRRL